MKTCIYRGFSMSPLMKNKDLLRYSDSIDITQLKRISISLVIQQYINYDSRESIVVHRVVKSRDRILFTKGDSSFSRDPDPVPLENVLGLVFRIDRGRWSIPVWRGLLGLHQMVFGYLFRILLLPLRFCGSFIYRTLASAGLFRIFWKPVTKKLVFHTPDGTLVKIIWKRRTVATWRPDSQHFVCRFPFALFLNRDECTVGDAP